MYPLYTFRWSKSTSMLENYFDILINSLNKRTETKIYSNPIRQKSTINWVKVFKNGPSKICGWHPLSFLKDAFHKFYLVHSWLPWPTYIIYPIAHGLKTLLSSLSCSNQIYSIFTQKTFTWSKLKIETLEEWGVCSKLTIKIPEQRYWRCSCVFNVNYSSINIFHTFF